MLTIEIPAQAENGDNWDSTNNVFVIEPAKPAVILELEHSLVSLSKWESEWEQPFLAEGDRTPDQILSYVKHMTLSADVPDEAYMRLTEDNMLAINAYVNKKMTATWFVDRPDDRRMGKKEVVTSEVIYYWLVSYQIPFECEEWHLNRLFTLIKVCNEKNKTQKPQKMNRKELMAQRAALNQKRRAEMGTTG